MYVVYTLSPVGPFLLTILNWKDFALAQASSIKSVFGLDVWVEELQWRAHR